MDMATSFDLLSNQVNADCHRPRYHVVSPGNWMNDPNGLIQYQGTYHLFYQYNPNNPQSDTKHWGHVTSPDLVHWRHLPIALTPSPEGPDADGCYSGCAIDLGSEVAFLYTGVRGDNQLPCVATSSDNDLISWNKYQGNPVIGQTPPDLDLVFYRDHTVWSEGNTWYMGIACRIRDIGGAVLVYRSSDLRQWEYLHPLTTGNLDRGDPLWGGTGWECPDFFSTPDGHHALIVSGHDDHPKNVLWITGDYQYQRLQPGARGLIDGGPSFYAPQSFADDQGRRVMFGWLRERRSVAAQVRAGWSGTMSLPRVLSINQDGVLITVPAPENALLRERQVEVTVGPGGETNVSGDTLELLATFDPAIDLPVGLNVRANDDGTEITRIHYSTPDHALTVDTRRSSTDPDTQGAISVLPVLETHDGPVTMRVYLDRSVIEVFVNDQVCITERIYPADPESTGISVIGATHLMSLESWEMGRAFEESGDEQAS